ncbi:hypothetical protein IJS64_03790 [bacterium]|nr:hypothetical protein [bacterium]
MKSRSWSSSEIAQRQLAALNNDVSVIAEFSFAVLSNFCLLSSKFFKSCTLLLSNFLLNSSICHVVKLAAKAELDITKNQRPIREIQNFFIRKIQKINNILNEYRFY